jgi:hypothetical protein
MNTRRYNLVMAVFPNARGFAYVVFEGPFSPVDWGMSDVSGLYKNQRAIRLIAAALHRLSPDALILRGLGDVPLSRNRRLQSLNEAIESLAETHGITSFKFTRGQIQRSFRFLGSPTRYAIVLAIAKRIPLFEQFVPPIRKIWKNEDRRMGLFDAAALALTFYARTNKGAG